MKELIIDPKFRDLIPKLTDEEYAQLEKNILADGRVKEPIVTWNNTIIDGHHRYYIVQKHPEIPFEIEDRDFANEYDAMAWACDQQLGRRNLNEKDRKYLIGKQYESEKLAHGGTGANRYTKLQICSSRNSVENHKTTLNRIAEEKGVAPRTVYDSGKFAKGVDIADGIVPGMKERLLHDKDNTIHMNLVSSLSQASPDVQEEAVMAMANNDSQTAKAILESEGILTDQERRRRREKAQKSSNRDAHTADVKRREKVDMTVFEDNEPEPYNADDLLEEIRCAKDMLHKTLKPLFDIHSDVLATKDGKKNAIKGLKEINKEIADFISSLN